MVFTLPHFARIGGIFRGLSSSTLPDHIPIMESWPDPFERNRISQ
jgi:hypothetical protein